MKIKYIVLCLLLALVGCQRDEEMEIGQVSVSNERLEESYSSVEISCTFQTNVTIKNVKAYVSTAQDFSSATSYSLTEKAKNTFGANIEGLKDASTYYVRYEISNRWSSKMVDHVSEFNTIPYTTPTVQTNEVTDVTYNSAIVGGTIKENGGQEIKECGIVYSKSPNPTIEDSTKVESNITKEAYTCTLTNLDFATTYYARAYATNKKGIAYGEEVSFKTNGTTASLDTLSISDLTATSAVISGALLNDGGESITALGICYGVNKSPTLENDIVINVELGCQNFSVSLSNLQKGTTYYVRAYATNNHGTIYSDELYFNTEMTIPSVTTEPVIDVSYTSATIGGNVTDNGGAEVTERGVVYSKNQNPTIEDSKVTSGAGLGQFTCNLIDLHDNTNYYARAYAVNEQGITYAEEVSFTTKSITIPTIETLEPMNISFTSAIIGGNLLDDGGTLIKERGVCYSEVSNPTIADIKIRQDTIIGKITSQITGFKENTIYYYCAYAINNQGISYGDIFSFKTEEYVSDSILFSKGIGKFSVSDDKQITFSKGNLRYNPKKNKWSFAGQLDYVGQSNSDINEAYDGWIDLFGWGTGNNPTCSSIDINDYSTFVDWGENLIDYDAPNTWRTLTYTEWDYILNERENASSLKGIAQVCGRNGLILLPDDWTCPSSLYFKSGFYKSSETIIVGVKYDEYQTIDARVWEDMQSSGAVFLPASGLRLGGEVNVVQWAGYYWSATIDVFDEAFGCSFSYLNATMHAAAKNQGQCVRLVKDVINVE